MTKVAVWCRHEGDNVIGIGPHIPWRVSSDFKRFRRITEGQNVLAGEKTYESFPNRTLPNRKIFVLTFNPEYEVSDLQNHIAITDVKSLKDFAGDLYIAGGASVYKLFMTGEAWLKPDVIVDCAYRGKLNPELKGEKIDITPCIDEMNKKYHRITMSYELDNIITTVWVKKGDFVDQSVIKRILKAIEADGENK